MKLRVAGLLASCLCLGLLALGCGNAVFVSDDNGPQAIAVGNKAFDAEMYEPALNAYEIAQESLPEHSEPTYNTANALYRQLRYREAIDLYDQILARPDLELNDWTTFNAANALYESGDPEQAIEMYKQALRNDPNDFDAKHNLELALAHLPQPPQPEPTPESSQGQPTPEPQQQQPDQNTPGQQETENQQSDQQNEGEPQESENEGEPQEGESEAEPAESEDEPSEPGAGDQPLEPIMPPTGLTEEQARMLLEMVGESAEPLRNAIQTRQPLTGPTLLQEW